MDRPETELLDPDIIKDNLNTRRIGRDVLVYNSTSSTNDIARTYSQDKSNDGLAIFAEEQTAGKGRFGNKWYSSRSQSILCSILLLTDTRNIELRGLTCAVAVEEAIGKPARSSAKIKWPNDIMLNGKKAAGILLETKSDIGSTNYIIGIGINCHQKRESFPPELQEIATSIDIESHSTVDRNILAKRLLSSMDNWLEIEQTNPEKVAQQWKKSSVQIGHRITLLYNGKRFTGNCIGIEPNKGLILQLDTGGIRMFDAAHTTIVR